MKEKLSGNKLNAFFKTIYIKKNKNKKKMQSKPKIERRQIHKNKRLTRKVHEHTTADNLQLPITKCLMSEHPAQSSFIITALFPRPNMEYTAQKGKN